MPPATNVHLSRPGSHAAPPPCFNSCDDNKNHTDDIYQSATNILFSNDICAPPDIVKRPISISMIIGLIQRKEKKLLSFFLSLSKLFCRCISVPKRNCMRGLEHCIEKNMQIAFKVKHQRQKCHQNVPISSILHATPACQAISLSDK